MPNLKRLLKKLSTLVLTNIFIVLLSATSQAAPVRFVVAGDSRGNDNGVNTTILGEIAQATIDENVDFILFTGDLVLGYTDPATLESQLATWRNTLQGVYDANIDVYPCRGNHDASSKEAWDNVFSGAYALPGNGPSGEENITYSFEYDNVFIIALDQYIMKSRVNQSWLEEQFTSNTQPHVFIFGHEPAFKVFHADCLDDYPYERNTFWNSIASECGRIYFAGHDHMYHHARIDDGDGNINNDLHQFVVATGGAVLYNWDGNFDGDNAYWTPQLVYHEKEYGYLLVEVDALDVTLIWKHRTAPGVYEAGGDVFEYSSSDTDGDGKGDTCDNCPDVNNEDQADTDGDRIGDACDDCTDTDEDGYGNPGFSLNTCNEDNCPNTPNQDQLDTYPPQGNGIGDACECEADFLCDGDVDADDVTAFLADFGREPSWRACGSPTWGACNGDFECDGDVDADDVSKFLEDFGREPSFKPCPACTPGAWCSY